MKCTRIYDVSAIRQIGGLLSSAWGALKREGDGERDGEGATDRGNLPYVYRAFSKVRLALKTPLALNLHRRETATL